MDDNQAESQPAEVVLSNEEKTANKQKWEDYLKGLSYRGLTAVSGMPFKLPGTVFKVGELEDGTPVYERFKHNPKMAKMKDVKPL